MGRKGVSKRKPAKPKNLTVSNEGGSSTASSIARIPEASTARTLGKSEAISDRKGGKKK